MTQDEYRTLMTKASMRLVYYDPNVDSDKTISSQCSSTEETVFQTVQHYIPNYYCDHHLQNQMSLKKQQQDRSRHEFAEPRFVPRNQRIQNFSRPI